MADSKRIAAVRKKLWKEDPKCFWCKEPTLFVQYGPRFRGDKNKKAATVDHLFGRNTGKNGKRINMHGKFRTLVLACWECNNKRSKEQNITYHKLKQWWKSGSFPFPFHWLGKLLKFIRKEKQIKK